MDIHGIIDHLSSVLLDHQHILDDMFDWTWGHAVTTTLVLLFCYFTIEFVGHFTVTVVNWFLLRSFAVHSRTWCFVMPPDKSTKLEHLQRQMKLFFYILAVIMRWPGWKDFGLQFWQCVVRAAGGYVAVNLALVFLVVFLESFIRTGHYLALSLGWTPTPVPPHQRYASISYAGYLLRASSRPQGRSQDHDSNMAPDEHAITAMFTGNDDHHTPSSSGFPVRDHPDSSNLSMRTSVASPATTSFDLVDSLNMSFLQAVPWARRRRIPEPVLDLDISEQTQDNAGDSTSEQPNDPSLRSISGEQRYTSGYENDLRDLSFSITETSTEIHQRLR